MQPDPQRGFRHQRMLEVHRRLVRVTQIINGGHNGIGDRRERFEKAKSVLV